MPSVERFVLESMVAEFLDWIFERSLVEGLLVERELGFLLEGGCC